MEENTVNVALTDAEREIKAIISGTVLLRRHLQQLRLSGGSIIEMRRVEESLRKNEAAIARMWAALKNAA